MRIGFGSDIHRLIPGRKLMIGGIEIPSDAGEDAHSDGDVLIHAIIDALLGAAALGDIGDAFPSSATPKDIVSTELLRTAILKCKLKIINIDTVITLEEPKLGKHKDTIRKSVASLLSIDESNVNVKAKTAEGLGDIGKGKAIKAEAVILTE